MSNITDKDIGAIETVTIDGARAWTFGGDDIYGAWSTLDTAVQNVLSTDVSDWMGCDLATAREALAAVMQ